MVPPLPQHQSYLTPEAYSLALVRGDDAGLQRDQTVPLCKNEAYLLRYMTIRVKTARFIRENVK
jgi:hypothetical protein